MIASVFWLGWRLDATLGRTVINPRAQGAGDRGGEFLTCAGVGAGRAAAGVGAARAAEGLGRLAAELSRRRNGWVSSAPTLFMTLSSDASAGRGGRLPGANPRFFGGASVLPLTSTRIRRFGSRFMLSLVLAARNAW